MDKTKVYHVVRSGTNIRQNGLGEPLMFDESVIDSNIEPGWEKMTVAEYDAKYRDTGMKAAPTPSACPIIPTLYTEADSIDAINIRQFGTNCYVSNNGNDIAMISGIHADLWPQRNYRSHLVNYADQFKGGQIYFTVVVTDKEETP